VSKVKEDNKSIWYCLQSNHKWEKSPSSLQVNFVAQKEIIHFQMTTSLHHVKAYFSPNVSILLREYHSKHHTIYIGSTLKISVGELYVYTVCVHFWAPLCMLYEFLLWFSLHHRQL
jgi:hypothetical protein